MKESGMVDSKPQVSFTELRQALTSHIDKTTHRQKNNSAYNTGKILAASN